MKATKKTKDVADLVVVRKNGEGGTTYKCLRCDLTKESNAYYEEDYRAMLNHATQCDGKQKELRAQSKDVQLYGGGRALRQMAWRVKNCVPNGNRLQNHEAMSLAQISLATGLNPFTGELWYIPGKGPMAGIRGLRRRAKEQSTYSIDFRAMKSDELKEHNVGTNDVGRICELYRHDVLQRAVEINKAAGEAVVPVKPIVGVGIWRKGDQVPAGKSSVWVAEKRAEADALRRGFDLTELPYADENGTQFDVADAENAGWSVLPSEQDEEMIRREAAINGEKVASQSTECYDDIVQRYLAGELAYPDWLQEIRDGIEADPKAGDPVNPSYISQLRGMAEERVTLGQFEAFLRVLFKNDGQRVEDLTFGAVRVLKPIITDNGDFEAQIISLLS